MSSDTNTLWTTLKAQYLLPILRWPWEILLLLTVFGWLYWQTMPPGISSWIIEGWDSAVLQITGSSWGLPHSPGYPLYTILANLFVRLLNFIPGLTDTAVVWRVSLWSTTTSLLTLVFLYLVVRKIARNRAAALTAAGILGISFIFWRGAIMAEVYSLNALIFVLTYWLALCWDIDRRDRWLIALGLVLGAGVAHHRTAFILPPTLALWTLLKRPKDAEMPAPSRRRPRWQIVARRWLILGGVAVIPMLSYLYLPWAAAHRLGQTWLYANTADWNTFWFVVVTREWWGLVQFPNTAAAWLEALNQLFQQQAAQITMVGVLLGVVGLIVTRRYFWLFGPPFLALTFFGTAYKVADLDSMLIPLTLTLCVGLGIFMGVSIRNLASWLVRVIRVKDEALRGKWLSPAILWLLSLGLVIGIYLAFRPLAEENYAEVDLSGDWQAVDLVEEVVAIAGAGTPLTIIGQDNSVLPDFMYAQTMVDHTLIEPLSTTTLARMSEEDSRALLRQRFEQGRRVLVDIETIQLGFIPWLSQAIDADDIFLGPTGHPYLWELLPRPLPHQLPVNEPHEPTPAHEFLEGQLSVVAYHQQIIHKRTGCFLRLTLFWRAKEPIQENYNISVQPLGGENVIDKDDHLGLMRGYLPTSAIQPGEIVRDEVDMLIRQPAALPGINLVVNLYQVQGDQFPTFGQVILPVTVEPGSCAPRPFENISS